MKIISPNAQWWPQDTTIAQHIARVGRICYKSKGKEPSKDMSPAEYEAFVEKRDVERVNSFWNFGHRSMFRHGSIYFFVKNSGKLPKWIWAILSSSPYIDYVQNTSRVWISTNMQYFLEHEEIRSILENYTVSEEEFIKLATEYKSLNALTLLRMTFICNTQISTSRELNRTSPNAIAEQSTRYVDLKKKGGVQICRPHWFVKGGVPTLTPFKHFLARFIFRTASKVSEWCYHLLLWLGLKPQDARGVLILDTNTVVAYTYNITEWQHIINLRYHGTTGTPHPNAKIVAEQIATTINERMRQYNPQFSI